MTTATKKKPKGALAELEALREVWAAAEEEARRLGGEHGAKLAQARELASQRQDLAHREPGLILHTGQANPDVKDNPIAAIDARIKELGDLEDLRAQVEHARRLAARARQDADRYIADHADEIIEQLKPAAEARVDAIRGAIEALRAACDDYIGLHARSVELTRAIPRVDGRNVPGIEHAAGLKKSLPDGDFPLPLPDHERRYALMSAKREGSAADFARLLGGVPDPEAPTERPDLTDDQLDALAERVAERLRPSEPEPQSVKARAKRHLEQQLGGDPRQAKPWQAEFIRAVHGGGEGGEE